mgnify:CR=1 FL=1
MKNEHITYIVVEIEEQELTEEEPEVDEENQASFNKRMDECLGITP